MRFHAGQRSFVCSEKIGQGSSVLERWNTADKEHQFWSPAEAETQVSGTLEQRQRVGRTDEQRKTDAGTISPPSSTMTLG